MGSKGGVTFRFNEGTRKLGSIPALVRNHKRMKKTTIAELVEVARLKENSIRLWAGVGVLTKVRIKDGNNWAYNETRRRLGVDEYVPRQRDYILCDIYLDCLLRYLGYTGGLKWYAKKLRDYRKERWREKWRDDVERKRQKFIKTQAWKKISQDHEVIY